MPPTPEPAPAPARVAAVIVTSGSAEQLVRCLERLGDRNVTIVVDNGSNDTAGLDERFPLTRLIRLPRNFGRTKALNIGIRVAVDTELILLLSPYVEIGPEAIEALADLLDAEPSVGGVCPWLKNPDGTPAAQVCELPSASVPNPPLAPGTPGSTAQCVAGDAIMFRAFFLRALRQIDERYGDYGSSVELAQQVLRANKKILIHPSATATLESHSSAFSGEQEADREVGTARFLTKHHGVFTGYGYLIKRSLAALFTLRLGKTAALLSQKKIDGN